MSEAAEFYALRDRYVRFRATELGQLFTAYDRATITYWAASKTVSDKRLRELDDAARAATNAFVAKLMELANV
jgi:hypothetical protein